MMREFMEETKELSKMIDDFKDLDMLCLAFNDYLIKLLDQFVKSEKITCEMGHLWFWKEFKRILLEVDEDYTKYFNNRKQSCLFLTRDGEKMDYLWRYKREFVNRKYSKEDKKIVSFDNGITWFREKIKPSRLKKLYYGVYGF